MSRSRFQLTRPIYKNGGTAAYWDLLVQINDGYQYDRNDANRMGNYMTFQALREAGLTTYTRGYGWEITSLGKQYIDYYQDRNCAGDFFADYQTQKQTAQVNKSSQAFDEMMGNPLQALEDLTTNAKAYTVTVRTKDGETIQQHFENVEDLVVIAH